LTRLETAVLFLDLDDSSGGDELPLCGGGMLP
jgi:hypothetical protein